MVCFGRLFFCITLFCFSTCNVAFAEMTQKEYRRKYANVLAEVNAYLLDLKTIKSDFTQVVSGSSTKPSTGKVYTDRLNKRFCMDYETGEVLARLVSFKNKHYYIDKEVNEVTELPYASTAINALFLRDVTGRDLAFKKVIFGEKEIQITFILSSRADEGIISITFRRKGSSLDASDGNVEPGGISLIKIESSNTGEVVRLYFKNFVANGYLDNSVFSVKV